MMWDSDWGADQWIAMSLMMIAFWGMIIVGIVALVRYTRSERPSPPLPPEAGARRILDERLVRGEIDLDEYNQLRDALDRS